MKKTGFLSKLWGRPRDDDARTKPADEAAGPDAGAIQERALPSTVIAELEVEPPSASAWYVAAEDYLAQRTARPDEEVLAEVAQRHGMAKKDLIRAAAAKKGVDRAAAVDAGLARRITFMSDAVGLQLYRWPNDGFEKGVEMARAVNEGRITLTSFTEAMKLAAAEENRLAAQAAPDAPTSKPFEGDWHGTVLAYEALVEAEPNWPRKAKIRKSYAAAIGIHPGYLQTMKYAMKGWRRLAAIDPALAERLKARPMGVCKFIERWPGDRFEEAVALARGVADDKVSVKEMGRRFDAVATPLPRGHHTKQEHRAAIQRSRAVKAVAPKESPGGGETFGTGIDLPEKRPAGPKKASTDNWVAAAREFTERRHSEPRTSHLATKMEISKRYGISPAYLATMAAALGGLERVRAVDPDLARDLESAATMISYNLGRWPDERFPEGMALAREILAGRADAIDLTRIGGTKIPLETPEARNRRHATANARWHEAASAGAAKRREIGNNGGILKAMADIARSYKIDPLNFANMERALQGWERAHSADPLLAERLKGASYEISKILLTWPEESFGDGLALATEVMDGLKTQASFKRRHQEVLEEKRREDEKPDDYHLAAMAAVLAAIDGPGQTTIASEDGDENLVLENAGVRTTVVVIHPDLDKRTYVGRRTSALETAKLATSGAVPGRAAIAMPEEADPEAMAKMIASHALKGVKVHVMRTRTVYDALPPREF